MFRWFGQTLTRKFTILLAGFLILQVAQLLLLAWGFRHIGQEAAFINDAGKQRMRTLLVFSHAFAVVHPVGSREEQQASIVRLSDTVNQYDEFYNRLAEFRKKRHWLDDWVDRERLEPAYRLLKESHGIWEGELHPLAVNVAMAPSAREATAALRKLETRLPGQLRRLEQAVATLDADVQAYTRQLSTIILILLGISLLLGITGFVLARRLVSRPLRQLIDATRAVADGAYDRLVPARASDELGSLGRAFNRMAATIGEKTARITAFHEISAVVTSARNETEVIERIMRHGAEAIGAKAACIALRDAGGAGYSRVHTYGLSEAFVAGMAFRPGGLADQVLQSGEPCLSTDVPDARHRLSELARREGIYSFVCLPLITHEEQLGVIYYYRHNESIFRAEEIDVLAAFARLAAQSIQNMRLYQQVADEARTDGLTGLLNRRVFDRRLEDEQRRAQRYGKPYTLLMIDVDHFKRVNDSYGHSAGDAVLKTLAGILMKQFREVDTVARYGGEEFVAILPEVSGGTAKPVAERVRRAIAATPFRLPDGREIGVTVSIGVSCFPNCGATPQDVLEHADQALYTAKEAGRNRVVLYREMLKSEIEKDPGRIAALLNESLDNISPIVTAISAKAPFFRGHMQAVEQAALQLARALPLSAEDTEALRLASRLHDIGMAAIPDAVLNKTTELTGEEWAQVRRHSAIGADWLARVPALKHLAPIVRHHHERWDGSGYPDGLKGEQAPYLARVLAVADAYVSMIARWPGHEAMPPAKARATLAAGAGTQFDPAIAQAWLRVIEETPVQA